ncbi:MULTISPECIES: response regulator transcription factor [Sphingobacterium]|jgi:DNA-binding NarL/FixJ family response regulator|uniref:DNA-binding response regulator n=1 Tax=Sphingobacterium multivorum TaxID=28454 RepID=A0A654DKG0_SPHMU|nr:MULTISPECIES: response regulator transcription factor [Sphingobacterium]HAE66234.1 DNA-binding response regulator [Sphingobacterium sp.]QQT45875.1 response regulator transcription factor [Sphingobacterium multivorum]SUJ29097.1 Nitrogen regulation protein C [Sphingobacterium multivorum]VXD05812.1 DNA-binding response regulator [Sphingobacterium multivorum]HBI88118.1 DNA-binding response regulator [Sphingobacterium sp.]
MIKILLVEDHMVVRNGIKLLLESQDGFEVVGEASNGKEALQFLNSNPVPDIVLTDISMEEMDGIELLHELKKQYPSIKVVILSMLNQINYVVEAFESGLAGYLVKNVGYNELLFGLNHIANGGRYMSEEIAMILLDQVRSGQSYAQVSGELQTDFDISDREFEVLKLIAEGYTNIEIADKIFLSKRTVEGHRQNLIDKAGVKNTAHLVKFAFERGILN